MLGFGSVFAWGSGLAETLADALARKRQKKVLEGSTLERNIFNIDWLGWGGRGAGLVTVGGKRLALSYIKENTHLHLKPGVVSPQQVSYMNPICILRHTYISTNMLVSPLQHLKSSEHIVGADNRPLFFLPVKLPKASTQTVSCLLLLCSWLIPS